MGVVVKEVVELLRDALNLGDRAAAFVPATPLFGSLPELDSFAVVQLIASLEERFKITISDDEITMETFESVGSLAKFVESKLVAA